MTETLGYEEAKSLSREEAQSQGLKTYISDKPCKKGHLERYTNNRNQCVPCNRARVKSWDKKNPDKRRERNMRRYAAYDERATRPKPDVCECCGQEKSVICFDHCHNTDEFRGWICHDCNTGIGKLGDDIAGLEMAIAYLRRFENDRNDLD